MKLMVCGHARHGKDQFCEFLGLTYESSSMVALNKVIWPEWGQYNYPSMESCFEDRINHRDTWYAAIARYNFSDLIKLARDIFAENDVYCGIRNREEFHEAKEEGLFDLAIWIEGYERVGVYDDTCKIFQSDCDIIVTNNGSLEELEIKAENLKKVLGLGQPNIKDLIVDWADEAFPNRTITNAITKLVLEEIPEYLMAQHDPMELADLGILLYDIAHLAGVDLETAIRDKMKINKNRKWEIDETTGLMRHIKEWETGDYCSSCKRVINDYCDHVERSCPEYIPF